MAYKEAGFGMTPLLLRVLGVWHTVYLCSMLALRTGLWFLKHVIRTLWRGWRLR